MKMACEQPRAGRAGGLSLVCRSSSSSTWRAVQPRPRVQVEAPRRQDHRSSLLLLYIITNGCDLPQRRRHCCCRCCCCYVVYSILVLAQLLP